MTSLVSVNLSFGATFGKGMAANMSTNIPDRLDSVLTVPTLCVSKALAYK